MRSSIIILFAAVSSVVAQTSPNFDLSENAIASGGGTSSGPTFTLVGSIGQPIAGVTSSSANFRLTGGFGATDPLGPTAAAVRVSGKVQTHFGQGIVGAVVTLTDATTGHASLVTTGSFGNFTLTDVLVGQSYILSVRHGRYQFDDATRILQVSDNVDDLVFTAAPQPIGFSTQFD